MRFGLEQSYTRKITNKIRNSRRIKLLNILGIDHSENIWNQFIWGIALSPYWGRWKELYCRHLDLARQIVHLLYVKNASDSKLLVTASYSGAAIDHWSGLKSIRSGLTNGQFLSEWSIFEFGHSPIWIFPFWWIAHVHSPFFTSMNNQIWSKWNETVWCHLCRFETDSFSFFVEPF